MIEAEPHCAPVVQLRVPLARQATGYTCGVAALQSVLHYFGKAFRQDMLAEALGSTAEHGTNYKQIVAFAQANGLECIAREGLCPTMLRALVDEGKPVIVALQAWAETGTDYSAAWDEGHYVVVVGYDDANFYFMDPSVLGNYAYLSEHELLVRWHDCFEENGTLYRLHRFGMAFAGTTVAYDPGACLVMG